MPRHRAVAIALALVVFLVLAGTGAGFAYYSATTTVAGTARGATTTVTLSGPAALATEYKFKAAATSVANYRSAALTLANTGTAPLSLRLTVGGITGDLAGSISLSLWVQTGGGCTSIPTTPGTVTTGLLNAPVVMPTGATTLAAGASVVVCAATKLTTTVAASQGKTISPILTLSGSVGNWVESSAAAAYTQTVFRQANIATPTCAKSPPQIALDSATLTWVEAAAAPGAPVAGYNVFVDTAGQPASTTVARALAASARTLVVRASGATGTDINISANQSVRIVPFETEYGTSGIGASYAVKWVAGVGSLFAHTEC